jgi:hypothetical protein
MSDASIIFLVSATAMTLPFEPSDEHGLDVMDLVIAASGKLSVFARPLTEWETATARPGLNRGNGCLVKRNSPESVTRIYGIGVNQPQPEPADEKPAASISRDEFEHILSLPSSAAANRFLELIQLARSA